MRYLYLIYSEPGTAPPDGTPEQAAHLQRWNDYTKSLADAGILLGGDPLQGVETATTLRVRDGKLTNIDGPFAETKEHLGGFYMVDVPNLDVALKWASSMPILDYGSVEVRPIWEYPRPS
jgi:hypothetical protein